MGLPFLGETISFFTDRNFNQKRQARDEEGNSLSLEELRECLGKEFARLEMRIFASMLLREYEWELLPNQDLDLVSIPTPHPRDRLKINFRQYDR